jgi:steroid 5-alpha reductase family enzyme
VAILWVRVTWRLELRLATTKMLSLLYCALFNVIFALLASFRYDHDFTQPYPLHLFLIAFLAVAIQGIVFLHASGILFGNTRTEKFFDLTGSLTYLSLIMLSVYLHGGIRSLSPRQLILSSLVMIWATRLGSFLFSRIQRHGGIDNRFTEIKPNFNRFCRAWGLQGVWVFLTAFPVFLINDQDDLNTSSSSLTLRDYLGLALWVIGFTMECTADYQKSVWKQKDTFINHGLWAISRHPNCTPLSCPPSPLTVSHHS